MLANPQDSATGNDPYRDITAAVRALLVPSPALFYQVRQERVRQHRAQLAALDQSVDELRETAFAAAVRLMSLDPQPRSRITNYMDVLDLPHGEPRQ